MATLDTGHPLIVMALKQESQGLFEARNLKPFYCGLGQIKAAYHLTRYLTENLSGCSNTKLPSLIVNLGTAGSFHLPQGQLVEVKNFVSRNHFLPSHKTALSLGCKTDLPKVVCGTGDTVEKKSNLTGSKAEYDIMDMEGYALAFVAKQFQIPMISIKYISDNSDDNTIADWKLHLRPSAEKLLKTYENLMAL